ncbi:hypothetical protein BP422_26900 [Brevibacillus formosus]|uniref:TniQ domain-containing protein n=1 Tax=Brevibacillus formosus TaxID=54913 RepID=A0A220MQ34_9BACL|nr:TniQ family protein [Brevibacillus formosus]ASJ56829.1 hypothetical protein BP422_26900 [Brevibacillus formosus]
MENNLLTVRLSPYADESLSSYLRRLTKANEINLLSFWNYLNTGKDVYAQYEEITRLDFCPSNILNIDKLAKVTRLKSNVLLSGYLYYLLNTFSMGTEVERSRFTSGMLRETLYFCPECLKDKKYHRLHWRINGIDTCITHRNRLQDKCPQCKKGIQYQDVKTLDKCPYCDIDLSISLNSSSKNDCDWEQQLWLYHSWNRLLNAKEHRISPQSLALRVLYLMNKRQATFDKERVKSMMQGASKLPGLLQLARDSLKQKRTLHISYVFNVLRENQFGIDDLLGLEMPRAFIDSVLMPSRLKKDTVACKAPWCAKFGVEGVLIQTGTSLKRKMNGEIQSYYLACLKCGCEYSFNAENKFEERTNFIKGYNLIKSNMSERDSIYSISQKTGLSLDQVKRCTAYFYTRGFKFLELDVSFQTDPLKLDLLIEAMKKNIPIRNIRNWDCWGSYMHFLVHRFHPSVMEQHLLQTRSLPKRINYNRNLDEIKKVVDELYVLDKTITIDAVAEQMGVSVNTIRNWGGCPYIRKMKKNQHEKRLLKEKESIHDFVEAYFHGRMGTNVNANLIIDHLAAYRS